MSVVRTFIALDLPVEIRDKLSEIIRHLKVANPPIVKWANPQNIHLTLKFLGDTPVESLPAIKSLIQEAAKGFSSFPAAISQLGSFPNVQHPRVVWVGLKIPPELNQLQNIIENQLGLLGFSAEDRPFKPHLTIGRVNQGAAPQAVSLLVKNLSIQQNVDLGSTILNSLHFFRSDLRPGGPVYTSLFEQILK
jgi:RNA 2',3'-cyclic 3'-phosphodiesterase